MIDWAALSLTERNAVSRALVDLHAEMCEKARSMSYEASDADMRVCVLAEINNYTPLPATDEEVAEWARTEVRRDRLRASRS